MLTYSCVQPTITVSELSINLHIYPCNQAIPYPLQQPFNRPQTQYPATYHSISSIAQWACSHCCEMTHCKSQVCGWGETLRSAGWCAVAVDVASKKKNAIPRNHEQNLSSPELKDAWKGKGGIRILAAHTLQSVPNCDVKKSVTCHVLWNSLGSRNVGHEVPPSLKNTELRFLCVYILLLKSQFWRLNCNKHPLLKPIYPFKTRIKSHLLFAGIIRSSPFSPR